MNYEKALTRGALRSIKRDGRVACHPVLQIIDVEIVSRKRMHNDEYIILNFYKLSVSDGENIMNSVETNSMVSDGELTKFSLIRINSYMISNRIEPGKQPREVIVFISLDVVVPGSIICKTIGNPQPINNNIEPMFGTEASVSADQVYEESSELRTKQQTWKLLIETGQYPRLMTVGALQSMVNNVQVKYPVMQVLGIKQLRNISGFNGYRLKISDGQHYSTFVMLANRLNNMIIRGYLNQFSIIYIRSYEVSQLAQDIRKVIVLSDLVCLTGCLKSMIGDPTPVVEHLGQVVENNIPASTDAFPEPSVEMDTSASAISPIDLDQEVEN